MIQAVNFSTNNYSKVNQNPSFAKKAPETFVDYEAEEVKKRNKKSKLAGLAGYMFTQFVAGAVVSGVLDGLTNGYRLIAKKPNLIPFKQIASRAGVMGGAFALIGLIFAGINSIAARRYQVSEKNS